MGQVSNDKSNERFLKESSYENHMKKVCSNSLSIKERDYMIDKVCKQFGIVDRFRPAVAKAANYLDGVRFWEIFDCAEKAHSPARYFIKAVNRELYGGR